MYFRYEYIGLAPQIRSGPPDQIKLHAAPRPKWVRHPWFITSSLLFTGQPRSSGWAPVPSLPTGTALRIRWFDREWQKTHPRGRFRVVFPQRSYCAATALTFSANVASVSHLLVGDVDGSAEHDPLHHLAAGRRGQRARVAIVAPQRGREQILQDERLQHRLFLCVGEVRGQCSRLQSKLWRPPSEQRDSRDSMFQHAGGILRRMPMLASWLRTYWCIYKLFISWHNEVSN